jgi:UDP-N-acetylmuramyl pentapeptide phosphotransferase/UDP-N-acetylglucosamine-1-phosphate transferase
MEQLVPGITSALASVLLVLTKKWHGKHSLDTIDGVQKFHCAPTPRIGGVAIFIGLIAAWFLMPKPVAQLLGLMLIAGLPAFAAGIIEDLTKRVGVTERLFATFFSGIAAWWLTGYSLNLMHIIGADALLTYLPVSIVFTAFAVGGVANSVNIIDGFNGLASGIILICFSAFGFIAWQAGDFELARLCIALDIVIAGFFVVNFPFGKIFMGDGGAYLLGFLLAWVAVMLPVRNPSVSTWASLMVCGYPVIETCFSIWRKHHRKGHHPGMPDNVHLHMLVYSRVSRVFFSTASPALKNGLTSVFIWPFSLFCALIGIQFSSNTIALICGFIVCSIIYRLVYLRLTQFVWCLTPATKRIHKTINSAYAEPVLVTEELSEAEGQMSLLNQTKPQQN